MFCCVFGESLCVFMLCGYEYCGLEGSVVDNEMLDDDDGVFDMMCWLCVVVCWFVRLVVLYDGLSWVVWVVVWWFGSLCVGIDVW